jgi:hypothetical protein
MHPVSEETSISNPILQSLLHLTPSRGPSAVYIQENARWRLACSRARQIEMGDGLRVAPHIINLPAQPPTSVSLAEMVQCSALSISWNRPSRIAHLSHVLWPCSLAILVSERLAIVSYYGRADPLLSRQPLDPSIPSFLVGRSRFWLLCEAVIYVMRTLVKLPSCIGLSLVVALSSRDAEQVTSPAPSSPVTAPPSASLRQAAYETPEMRRRGGAISTFRPCRGAPVIGRSMRLPPPIRTCHWHRRAVIL